MEDLLDCVECLHPGFQIVMEVDWSSGHAHHREDALSAQTMNVSYGGKQAIPSPSVVTAECLGPHGPKLKPNDTQHFRFRAADETGGSADSPPVYKPSLAAEEYIGKAKGMKQILWERGLWVEGMVDKVADDDSVRDQSMSMRHVLSQCKDFREEVSALQTIFLGRGHIREMTPKGHCELAGVCIEYCWGRMKKYFRKYNRADMKTFNALIIKSMSRAVLPLRTARKFARRARSYQKVYAGGVVRELVDITHMVKQYKLQCL
jgi:hypothetical protein